VKLLVKQILRFFKDFCGLKWSQEACSTITFFILKKIKNLQKILSARASSEFAEARFPQNSLKNLYKFAVRCAMNEKDRQNVLFKFPLRLMDDWQGGLLLT